MRAAAEDHQHQEQKWLQVAPKVSQCDTFKIDS